MHELALAQDALKKAKAEAEVKGLKPTYIKFGIGATRISHQEEFKELFSQMAQGTILENAKVEIEIIPVKTICADCQIEFNPKEIRFDCPNCSSGNIQVSSGQELIIKEMK